MDHKTIWIKVSNDEYENILEMGDSAEELARRCGVSVNAVRSGASHYKHDGVKSRFRMVDIDIDEDDDEDGEVNDD